MILGQQHKPLFKPWKHEIKSMWYARGGEHTALSELKPDYMGFIFWAPSSRYVNDNTPSTTKIY